MFSMPKMEMVEFEVEAIMAASAEEETTTPTSSRKTGTTHPDQGEWD